MVRQHLLVPLAGGLLGALLLWRLFDGTAANLVQGWYEPILLVTALGLLGLAGVAAAQGGITRPFGAIRVTGAGALTALLVGIPIVVGLAFAPDALGSRSLDDGEGPRQFSASAAGSDPVLRNIYQWAYEFQTRPPAEIAGDAVEVIGFVYHKETDTGDRFHVARFVVACCVADAQGFALPVQWKGGASLVDDRWIRIKGRVATGPDGSALIQATEIEEIEAPSNPYIYP